MSEGASSRDHSASMHADSWISHSLRDSFVSCVRADIGQRRVRAVQHPQLHALEGLDIRHQLHPRVLKRRSRALAEIVLKHPLEEGLVRDDGLVTHAGCCLHLRDQIRGRRGTMRSTMEQGKRTSRAIQSAKPIEALSHREHGCAQHPAIAGQVVQRQQSERRDPPDPPPGQRLHDEAGCGTRCGAGSAVRGHTVAAQVVPDIRMIEVERLITGAAAVSLFP